MRTMRIARIARLSPTLLLSFAAFALAALAQSPARAAFDIDQSNDITTSTPFVGDIRATRPEAGIVGVEFAQTFTVAATGTLGQVSVRVGRTANTTAGLTFEIRSTLAGAPGGSLGSLLASSTLDPSAVGVSFTAPDRPSGVTSFAYTTVDFSSFGISVNPGDVLAIVLRSSAVNGGYYLPVAQGATDSYTRGGAYFRTARAGGGESGAFQEYPGDISFRTTVGTVSVPEPGSAIGLAVGLAGVMGVMGVARGGLVAQREGGRRMVA